MSNNNNNNNNNNNEDPPRLSEISSGHSRAGLLRGARVLQEALDARHWTAEDLTTRLKPPPSESTVVGWLAAKHVPAKVFREAMGELLGIDPDLLVPEYETVRERNKRESTDKGLATFAARNIATPMQRRRRRRGCGGSIFDVEPVLHGTALLPAVPNHDDTPSYKVDLKTGMGELRVVMRRPHPELQPLADLIAQELVSRRR